jgi:hypothetical protein
MADRMNILVRALLGCLAPMAAATALAQSLQDPTRPPPSLDSLATGGGAVQSGLQTIIRRVGAKPAAVIAGQYVELGGMVGEARLVKVGEDRVELRGATGTEVLFLTPVVEKKSAVAEQPKARKGAQAATKDRAGK